MSLFSRSLWQKIQHYSWLILGLVSLFFALTFWAMTDKEDFIMFEQQEIVDAQTQIQPQKVAATANLGTLSDVVKPLDTAMRVTTSGNHDPEFRGTKFIQSNQKNWTIELFRISDENIIKNYLKSQKDRHQFKYFRLSGEDHKEQFVLTYGIFNREVQATSQLAQLNLSLPSSIQPKIMSISSYTPWVNDLGMEEMKSGTERFHEIVLKNAPIPVAPQPSALATQPSVSTTKTTVTRRDVHGNVVDVRQQLNNIKPPAPSSNSIHSDNLSKKNNEQKIANMMQ